MDFILPADMPKGVKSRYTIQNPKFPKGSFVLWYQDLDSGAWKFDVFDNVKNAIEQGKMMGPSENWVVTQAVDYSIIEKMR